MENQTQANKNFQAAVEEAYEFASPEVQSVLEDGAALAELEEMLSGCTAQEIIEYIESID